MSDDIRPIGEVGTVSGGIQVLYDSDSGYVGLNDGITVMIMNVNEAEQVMALMREAINLTRMSEDELEMNIPPPGIDL